MRPALGPKFRRRAGARPDEILDAALAVFTDKGFEVARVEDIAAAAKLSKGAVYLYFDSKEELLRGLIEREIAPIASRLAALANAGTADPKAAVRLIISTATQLLDNPRIFATPRLVLSVAPRFKEIAAFYRRRVVDEAIGAISVLHRAGVAGGVFRDIDSEAVARMIMGPLFIQAMRKHVLGAEETASPERRIDAHIDILFEGLVVR